MGREGAVLARLRDGDGSRESTRTGDSVSDVRERWMVGFSRTEFELEFGSSASRGSVGVAMVIIVVPDKCLSCVLVLV